jgi:hypothetical protein
VSGVAFAEARISSAAHRMYGSIAASTIITLRPSRSAEVVTCSVAM